MISIVENTKSDQNFQVIVDKSVLEMWKKKLIMIEFITLCNKSNTTQIFQMCIHQSNALILYKPFVFSFRIMIHPVKVRWSELHATLLIMIPSCLCWLGWNVALLANLSSQRYHMTHLKQSDLLIMFQNKSYFSTGSF